MINPFKEVNWNPDLKERRQFAISLMIGFPCLAVIWLLAAGVGTGQWPWQFCLNLGGIGLAAGLVLAALPQWARPFYWIWFAIGCSIGIVVSNLLLIGFFYLVMTPIGWALRLAGRDALGLKFEEARPTYWEASEPVLDMERYYQQF